MKNVRKTAIVGYSAKQMYSLVDDVMRYPEFLPWCSKTAVSYYNEERTDSSATLWIDFHGMTQSFTTRNTNMPFTSITLNLEKGPFRHLKGQWTFTPLPENRCRVDLELHYEFSNWLLEKMLAPVFDMVTISLVDAFHQRARTLFV